MSFTDDAGNEETLTSEATRINTPATGTITIGGTAQVHEILRVDALSIVDTDGLSNARTIYHWLVSDGSGNEFTLGAFVENPIYVVQAREEGMTIWVEIAFNDDAGNSERLRSPKIGVVTAAANPTVPQAPEHRRVTPALAVSPKDSGELEVSWSMPTYPYGDGGSVITGAKVQWKEASGSWDTEADVSELVVVGNCFACRQTITGLTNGVAYTVRVFVTNALGDSPPSDELTSTPTDGSTFTLSGISRTNYPEDEPHLVAYYTVSGSGSAITWSLSGDDSDDFSIVAGRTVSRLEFDPKPNHQSPTDMDRDNQYQVTVHASDGTQEHTLEVTVVVEFRGLPTINGSAQVGETLTADTSGISDAHEMYFARFGYQWLADDVEIDGATSSTYTLIDSDVGKAIKVRVSFTDDAGNNEELTSDATETVAAKPNSPATGAPTIIGTAQVGETLTADTSGIADDDGLGNVQYEYQWLADDADISGATNATYTLAAADEGKAIKVQVGFADDAGNDETLTSAATDAVAAAPQTNIPAAGAPTIGGTAQVGQTLTANTSGVADADGLGNVQYEYQWLADDADISGATNATYTPVAADEGKVIKVRVSFTDDAGNEETLTSAATDAVAAAPQTNIPAAGAPTIGGTAQVGQTLTANTSGVADADGLGNIQYEYQWLADDSDISGATNATYTPVAADEGKVIKVRVSFTDDAGNQEMLTSAPTAAVAAAPTPNSPATGAPTISGTAQVGETLTADTSGIADADGLSNVQYEYQWLADDSDISGATNATYTPVAADEDKVIKVRVSFTDDAGNEETLTSAATAVVTAAEPAEPPAKPRGLSATATHDRVVLTWDDPQDDSITGYVILRRLRYDDPSGQFDELVADTGTAAATYADNTVAANTDYTYRIKAINGAGTSERSRWFHIKTQEVPVPDKPTGLSATATHDSVTLTWDDPQDDSITGYVILRRVRENDEGGEFSELVADTGTAAATYTDDTVVASITYTYRIKAINEYGVSERSRWFHIDTPAAP